MKKSRVAWIGLLLIALLVAAPFHVSAASKPSSNVVNIKTQNVNLNFDGQALKLPEGRYTFIYQDRTYVPIRYISYALLKHVGWDPKEHKVTVSEPTEDELTELKMELQLATSNDSNPREQATIPFIKVEAKLVFDDIEKMLPADQSLFNYDGSIYVPVRFLSESVGTEIGWDPVTRTVIGESAAYRAKLDNEEQDAETEEDAGSPKGDDDPIISPGAGGGGGGTPIVKPTPTYEQITASAEASMASLHSSCEAALFSLVPDYLDADEAGQASIRAQALQEIDNCTAQFNSILANTSAELTANGYDTAIIEEYRAEFQQQMEAGRRIAESMG